MNKGVKCFGATLELDRVTFDNAPAEVLPFVDLVNCTAAIDHSELRDAPAHAVVGDGGGTLSIATTRISGSIGNAIQSGPNHRVIVSQSILHGGEGIGISASGPGLTVERSEIFQNRLGGIRAVNGSALVVDISNNFIYRNGRDPDSELGGLVVDTTTAGNRVVHNTIVWNDMEPGSPYAGGFYCRGTGTFTNNLIFHNFAGNVSQPNAQYVGPCNVSTSTNSISYGTSANEMHFLSETTIPFDYHLADRQSPAVDRAVRDQDAIDFDGEPRGDFPDMGADELP